ncbi:MAG: phenylalanine--tRNA ligase subunit alpha [Nitrospirota bacterium]|nr:phenylalanine--tRNA ligase subunit alpha [Nitrospirota bacterium]
MNRPGAETLVASLHPLEVAVIQALSRIREASDTELAEAAGLDAARRDMACGWLVEKGVVEIIGESVAHRVSLTEIGTRYARMGTPETRIVQALRAGRAITMASLEQDLEMEQSEAGTAVGALKKAAVVTAGSGGVLEIVPGADLSAFETVAALISHVATAGEVGLEGLPDTQRQALDGLHRKRGKAKGVFRVDEQRTRTYALTPLGQEVGTLTRDRSGAAEIGQLTSQMLADGSWKDKDFRRYNIALKPPRVTMGRKHPYRAYLDNVKAKMVGMGFRQMTSSLVQNEFWNNDALFMPQFHPARDIHDAYFVSEPKHSKPISEPFFSAVAKVHADGGDTGSTGWNYRFREMQSRRLVLRSQGTADSAHKLAEGPDVPGKYFSIARCFRYDQVDATHAPDFFQVEGIVLGEGIHFRTLLGLLKLFARELARAEQVKFVPAYFPFTEPSVEIHARHPKLGWIELGGAGLFRPEVTRPLGVTTPVIAWGLGLDRMAMVALNIHDIRDLFSSDLDLIRTTRGVAGTSGGA